VPSVETMHRTTTLAALLVAAALAPTPAQASSSASSTTSSAAVGQSQPPIRFSRIVYNSPGADTGSNSSLNAEWARITNFTAKARKLTGWTVRDISGHIFHFPTYTLRAGASVKIHTGRGANTRTDLYWRQDNYVWNNDGDTAILKNAAGVRIDLCKWGSSSATATNC